MKKAMPIFRRELAAYFYSPMAYIVIAVFVLITGWFFTNQLFLASDSSMRSIFDIIPFIFVFLHSGNYNEASERGKKEAEQSNFYLPCRLATLKFCLENILQGSDFLPPRLFLHCHLR